MPAKKKIKNIGAGDPATAEVRYELSEQPLPDEPSFVIRAAIEGPLALTTLSLDLVLLLPEPVKSTEGWIVVPLPPLSVGQDLGWTVFSGYEVPILGAYLIINGALRYLARKEDLAAGGSWATGVTLRAYHLA